MAGTIPAASVAAPPVPNRVEPRLRLLRRMLATGEMRVVLVTAPAGYGKTALLHAWAEAEARPVTWLPLGRGSGAARGAATALELALAELRAVGGPAVLVVDDADAGGGVVAARALDAVDGDLPAAVTLVLAGRCAPPRALGRLRSAWPVLELGADDLAMTRSEAETLLEAAGLALGAPALTALMGRTEGWPCGLRLASVALRAQDDEGDADAAAARFGGDDQVVGDYLREEMLAELSADRRAFLVGAAVLETLSGPVCDAVLGRQDSGLVLFELGRSPAPVSATDRSEEHFRLHPLARDMLRAELHRTDPARERALHARASAYFEGVGHVGAAIDHAIAGGDADRAAALLWAVAPAALFDGRGDLLRGWLAELGDPAAMRRPLLALTAALTDLLGGDRDAVERWLAAARRGMVAGGRAPSPDQEAAIGLVRAVVAPDDARSLADHADAALARTGPDGPWRALCHLVRGAGHALVGERAAARADLDEGARRGAVVMPAIEALCLAQLALMALFDGDADEGAVLAERARTHVDARGLDDRMVRGLVVAASAFGRAHRGRVQEARADIAEACRILGPRDGLTPWYDAQARLALARAQLRLSDVTAARALTAEAARCAARIPDAAALRAWIDDAWARADTFAVEALAGPSSLTMAELRVLRFLPSHLSFREIAERLDVSGNTVKTQAHAIYRKLDACSRSTAVTRARALGLLDA